VLPFGPGRDAGQRPVMLDVGRHGDGTILRSILVPAAESLSSWLTQAGPLTSLTFHRRSLSTPTE
jgi:hypothetical protein